MSSWLADARDCPWFHSPLFLPGMEEVLIHFPGLHQSLPLGIANTEGEQEYCLLSYRFCTCTTAYTNKYAWFFSVSLTMHVIDNQSDLLMENFPHAHFSFILINHKMIVKCCSGWHTMNAFRTIHWQTLFKSPFLLLQMVTEVKSF